MIDVTMSQIEAAQQHDFTALAHINSEMESRVCQLARKVAAGNRELVEDLEQDGRLAMLEYLPKFNGSTVAEFFEYISTAMRGAMTNSRKVMGRSEVSRHATAVFESAVKLAGDVSEAERIVQDPEIMGGPHSTLSSELAYAARLSYQGAEGLTAHDTDGHEYENSGMVTYEIDYDAIADAADADSEGGRPFTWQVAGRTIERSVKAPKDAEQRAQVMDAVASISSGCVGAEDLSVLSNSVTSRRSHGLDAAFAILASRAAYDAPEAEEATPIEIGRRLSRERIERVRSAVKYMPADTRIVIERVYGLDGGTVFVGNHQELSEELGLHQDAAASVMAGALDHVRRALKGERSDEGKACSVCHIVKPLDEFYVANKKTGTRRRNCKRCQAAKALRTKSDPARKSKDNAAYRARKKSQYGN